MSVDRSGEPVRQPAKGLLYNILFWIRVPIVVGWFLISSAIGIAMAAMRPGDPTNSKRFSNLNSWLILKVLRLKVNLEGRDTMWNTRPCVFVTNHQANEDLFFHGWVFPTRSVVTGKRELIRIPLFGWMFKIMGNIMLDRSHLATAKQQLEEAAQRIRKERISVWLFPEGHRNRKDQLLPFKKGGFHLAVLAQVPVVPIATQRYGNLLDVSRRNMFGGTVTIRVLDPIPTEGLTEADVPALAERAQAMIGQALDEMGPAR